MHALLFAALIPPPSDPIALLKEVQRHYANLKRFQATIEHHNDSGLFPGDYTQVLTWTGKGMFELRVSKPSSYKPTEEKPGSLAPNYTADGTTVMCTWPDGRTSTESVTPRENTSPGWEVSGGLALTFLEKTKIAGYIVEPTEKFKLTWSVGSETNWQGVEVRELIAEGGRRDQKMHIYLDKTKPLFIGARSEGGLNGWMIYRDIKAQ